jgi:hypothetical protein
VVNVVGPRREALEGGQNSKNVKISQHSGKLVKHLQNQKICAVNVELSAES